jgi:outer membrane protein assembly factor BamB
VSDKSGGFSAVLDNGSFLRVNAFGEVSVTRLPSAPFAVIPLPPAAGRNGGTRFAALYANGRLDCIDTGGQEEGAGGWARLPAHPAAAAERGGLIAVLMANGELTLVSPERGILWNVKTLLGESEVTIDWNERGIYLLSQNGGEAYNLKGERLWNMRLTGSAAAPVLDEDGILYSSGEDWIFYAYRVEDREGRPAGVYSLEPEGSYGLGSRPPEGGEAYAYDPNQAALLLDAAENSVRFGRLGRMEPEFTWRLFRIADGRGGGLRERLRALRLLGLIGSRETVPFLAALFRREQNTLVKSAAAEAIGAIGVDPDGLALAAFAEAIAAPAARLNQSLLSSIASGTGKLCRFSGPPLSERGIPLLVSLADFSQPKSVRRRAGAELAALYKK